MEHNVRTAKIILRWGLAFVFFYAAISGLLSPDNWIGYLPRFLQYPLALTGFSIFEIILAAWLFVGKKLVWSSMVAILLFAGMLISNLGAFDVVFRDVGLFFAALALLELARGNGE